MRQSFLFWAVVSAGLAVAMGAFGAHGLKEILTPERLAVYQTAVKYQMWHALGLGLLSVTIQLHGRTSLLLWVGRLLLGGIVLFSGSLYLLVLLDIPKLGMITPIGGLAWIIAWSLFAIFAARQSADGKSA